MVVTSPWSADSKHPGSERVKYCKHIPCKYKGHIFHPNVWCFLLLWLTNRQSQTFSFLLYPDLWKKDKLVHFKYTFSFLGDMWLFTNIELDIYFTKWFSLPRQWFLCFFANSVVSVLLQQHVRSVKNILDLNLSSEKKNLAQEVSSDRKMLGYLKQVFFQANTIMCCIN